MKYSRLLPALLALVLSSPIAAQDAEQTPAERIFEGLGWRQMCIGRTKTPDLPTFDACRRLVREAAAAIDQRGHGNISVNMGACLYYCEALYPGIATGAYTKACYLTGSPAVIRGKIIALQSTPGRDFALDLAEPMCLGSSKGKRVGPNRIVIWTDPDKPADKKRLSQLVGKSATLYFDALTDGEPPEGEFGAILSR